MRFLLWTIGMVALAGCADVSGLSNLQVSQDGGGGDASADAGIDANRDETGADADADAAPAPTKFCATQLQTSPYDFCADFDENDLKAAFDGSGKLAAWTQVTSNGPTLSTTVFDSAPASAAFTSGAAQLTYAYNANDTTVTSFTVMTSLYINVLGNSDATVLEVQIDPTHSASFVITSFGITANEIQGTTTQSHPLQASLGLGKWHTIGLQVTSGYLGVYADSKQATSIPRAQPSTVTAPSAMLVLTGTGASVSFDNVVISHQ